MSESPRLRTALVTGSARRLGREVALALAGTGWQVAVHFRESGADAAQTVADCLRLASAGARIESFQADLDDEAQARALVPRVVERFGTVDAVVNNASMFEHDSIGSFGYDALLAHVRTNTGAPILLAQALHQHVCTRLRPRGHGGGCDKCVRTGGPLHRRGDRLADSAHHRGRR
jgi:NAD(P)-dependent dehydrogenase (short-subunit alcohol dehydrogenase family)